MPSKERHHVTCILSDGICYIGIASRTNEPAILQLMLDEADAADLREALDLMFRSEREAKSFLQRSKELGGRPRRAPDR